MSIKQRFKRAFSAYRAQAPLGRNHVVYLSEPEIDLLAHLVDGGITDDYDDETRRSLSALFDRLLIARPFNPSPLVPEGTPAEYNVHISETWDVTVDVIATGRHEAGQIAMQRIRLLRERDNARFKVVKRYIMGTSGPAHTIRQHL